MMSKRRRFCFLLIALLLAPMLGYAATISVNTKAEFTSAISAINPGDIISIENGTYTDWGVVTIPHTSDCTQSQPCRITTQSTGGVTFSGNGSLYLDIRSRWWIIEKLKFQNQTAFGNGSSPSPGSPGPVILYDGAQDVIVQNLSFTNISGGGAVVAVIKLNGTRDTLRNTFQTSTVNGYSQANGGYFIYVLSKSDRGFNTDFNILNNVFQNRTTTTAQLGHYWIRYGNGQNSAYQGNNNLTDPPRNANLVIRGNIFSNDTINGNAHDTMHLKVSGATVESNILSNVGRVTFRNGENNKFLRNIIINPSTAKSDHALFAVTNLLIANNLFYTNRGDKTAVQLSRGNSDTNGDGTADYQRYTGRLYNNTFDGFSDESIQAAKNANGNLDGTTNLNPIIADFKCNVIRQNAGTMLAGLSCATLFTAADHNSWSGTATAGCITQSGAGDVLAAPQWNNPAGGDYTLNSGSPLISACVDIPGFPETNIDLDGNQRDNNPDIGAYEFAGAPPPPPGECDNIFGGAPDYLLCGETSLTCKFNVTLNGSNCSTFCGSLGKTCVAAFDNPPSSCTESATDTCTTNRTDEICECEKADAPPPPPPGPQTFYVDSSCGTQGNGTTTTCGANGPWTSLKYALETVDCAGMVPGDTLEIRGMTTTPNQANANWYGDTYYAPNGSISVDSACNGITIRPYSGATEHVVVDGSLDIKSSVPWTSIGSGVYESGSHASITIFPHRAWYKRGANNEETLDLIQSVQTCSSALAVGKMRYNPISKTICAHLSDGTSPAATAYFRVPVWTTTFDLTTEDVDDVTIEADGVTFLITRFARELIRLNPSVNQNITLSGLTLSEASNAGIVSEGTSGLGNYNITNNTLTNLGETGIRWANALGSATIIGNTISNIGVAPNFEQCLGVGAGCHAFYDSSARGIAINNCATLNDVTRATVQDNTITNIGGGYNGLGWGIDLQNCTHANIIDSNLITNSSVNSQTGFRAIGLTGIPASQYHDHNIISNNRCEDVDYCLKIDYDTATSQVGFANFFYGNTCLNPNTTCWQQGAGANVDGAFWFRNNLAVSTDGDGVLLLDVPASNLWDDAIFTHNGFECSHANCSGVTIATFQGSNFKRAGDCTPATDCIEDINANSNIYSATMNVTPTTLELSSGSAAIDAGVNLTFLQQDYKKLARPFGVASDIGAHEFDGSAPTVSLTQQSFKFGDRWESTSDAPLAPENQGSRFYAKSQFTLRLAVSADAGTPSHQAELALFYQLCNPSCGSYTQITPTCASNPVCLVDDPSRVNGSGVTSDLTLSGRVFLPDSAFFDTAEDGIEVVMTANDQLELEFSIGFCDAAGTCGTAALNDTYNFRVYNTDGSALDTYAQTPSLRIGPIRGTILQNQ